MPTLKFIQCISNVKIITVQPPLKGDMLLNPIKYTRALVFTLQK